MPQFILLAMAGAGLYAGMRALARASAQFAADMKRGEDALRQQNQARQAAQRSPEAAAITLELDPESGVYKPAKR